MENAEENVIGALCDMMEGRITELGSVPLTC